MPEFEDLSFALEDFSGTVRLFPLPNLVLFPHVMQPLHVFEPRYREMLEEAMAGDRLITMATLAPGWEADYDGRPPLLPVACLGRVVACHRLENGSYNILVCGLKRGRLLRELPPTKSFREAAVELCEDEYPPDPAETSRLQARLREAFLLALPDLTQAHEQVEQFLSNEISLGVLTDIVGYLLDVDLARKEELLAEMNVHRRAELLLEHLAEAADAPRASAGAAVFPPEFSVN